MTLTQAADKSTMQATCFGVGRSNNSFNASGMSLSFIDNLPFYGVDSRRVNSGVMSPLHIDTTLISAAPLLCNADVDEIIEWLVECE